jgi:hypothetical protein
MALSAASDGHSFATLAAMVGAGVVGVALLAYAIASLSSGARRDKARRRRRADRAHRDSTASTSRSEPSWEGRRDRKAGARPVPAELRRSGSIPRITDEVAAPRIVRPEPHPPPRPIQTPTTQPKPATRTAEPVAPPTGANGDRVWNMLDEIRHVPLATRLASIPGVPPRRPPAAAAAAPLTSSKVPVPAPVAAPVVYAAPLLPAPVPPTAPSPSAPVAATAPARTVAQEVPPDSDFGSSSRWSDEKREKLRRAVDRLRASREPQPLRREGDATPAVPAAAGGAQPILQAPLQPAATGVRSFVRNTVSPAHDFQASSTGTDAHARWVGPDEVVVVSGHAIRGMVYVGASGRFGDVEPDPALIDDELDVDAPDGTQSGSLDAAHSSYASLEPAHRGAYLQWLADGRPASAPASFALIFFMGLERRVIESRGQAGVLPELDRLATEMRRLVDAHGMDSFSLHHHATRLAALVDMQSMGEPMYRRPVPALHRSYDLPVELRLALGQVAHDQVPLPVAWAMAWLLVDQTFHLRSPMTRCPDEFRRLFEARYGERFGAGLQLPDTGRKLQLTYMPVSRMLASADGHHFEVDSALDVDASCAAAGELRTLCSLCAEDLFEYCRYVGRHPAAVESPDAELRLPAAIRSAGLKARIAELRLACQAGRQPANLNEAALALWGAGLADKDSAGLLQALLVAEGITVGPRQARGAAIRPGSAPAPPRPGRPPSA